MATAPGKLVLWQMLIIILFTVNAVSSQTLQPIPEIIVDGTYYDASLAVGRKFSSQIRSAISNNTFFSKKIQPYYQTAEGKELYDSFLKVIQFWYPQYLDELRGLADGAGVPYDTLVLWNMKFEWSIMLGVTTPPSCSDLYLVNEHKQSLMGHNEDGGVSDLNTVYFVRAVIRNSGKVVENFTVLCYAGELCGNAFGFNSLGLVFTVNALFPKDVSRNSLVRNVLNRAFLALGPFNIPPLLFSISCASGFSVNFGDLRLKNVSNIEVATGPLINWVGIKNYNYHFNMYLRLNVSQRTDLSSIHRLERVQQLLPPTDSKDIRDILGDTNDPNYPIYRTAKPPDDAATICTAEFDLIAGTLEVYRGNPKEAEPERTYRLPHFQ